MEGGRRQGRQRKRWEDDIKDWTSLSFAASQRSAQIREKWRAVVRRVVSAPTTIPGHGTG